MNRLLLTIASLTPFPGGDVVSLNNSGKLFVGFVDEGAKSVKPPDAKVSVTVQGNDGKICAKAEFKATKDGDLIVAELPNLPASPALLAEITVGDKKTRFHLSPI